MLLLATDKKKKQI